MLNFDDMIRDIQAGWSASWLKSGLSIFTVQGNFLKRSSSLGAPISPYDFMNAYLESSPFFRSWFKSYIKNKHLKTELDLAEEIFGSMKVHHIFNEDNFNLVASHANPWPK